MESLFDGLYKWAAPLFILLVLLCLLYTYGKQPYGLWKRLGVNGPEPTVLFGNIQDLYGPEGSRTAYSKWQSEFGRVYGIYFFRHPALVITEPELMKQVLVKDFNDYRDRMAYDKSILLNHEVSTGLFFARGGEWKKVRSIFTPSFSLSKVKSMTYNVNRSAERLGEHVLKLAREGTPWGAKLFYGAYAMDVVTGTGFSIDVDSVSNLDEPFTRHGRSLFIYKKTVKLLAFLSGAFPALMSPITKTFKIGFFKRDDMDFFYENLTRMIDARMNEEKINDIFQSFINVQSDEAAGGLNRDEIVAQGIMLFIAGYETASSTLQFLTYELAKHPEALEKVIAEIDNIIGDKEPSYDLCSNLRYTEAAINETLRMYPPLSVLTRQSNKPTTLNGIEIPAETGFIMPLFNIQRDPEYWQNPNSFNPDRFVEGSPSFTAYDPFTFIPFGIGPRLCIGMKLGMLEMKLALVHILRRVVFTKATPELLHINDFTSILQPSQPIMIYAKPR
ncbi:cytochrome P450 3A29-like [Physella acuta]|uniref:cytochrome P450 3A29-like n=1 Tax=Physella acuta TaxID=109671 RepID=UPI0027DCB40C|nr:cytochrome P450 3A29-like [Physella acuta]XP_059153011.1 cytochrome P450 3A29-like [Physella acuta]XP_059153012.1 cytochrome P450 3A29-like [Physella acuta]XP_059153013.1 cytochrome P450 3A29-like [Physella acuta]XP_059153014.1 cytochrome P450 3A29-like [Physella acuta]